MYKIIIVSVAALCAFSFASVPVFAAESESNTTINIISTANAASDDTGLLQATNAGRVNTDAATSQRGVSQPQQVSEKGETGLSSLWLFAVALCWFVMLSNRRSI